MKYETDNTNGFGSKLNTLTFNDDLRGRNNHLPVNKSLCYDSHNQSMNNYGSNTLA